MTAGALKIRVEEIVQDASFSGGILALFNRCLGSIAARCAKENKILPGLQAEATVVATAATNKVALPATYSRGLFFVSSAAQKNRVKIQTNFTTYLRRWPDPARNQAGCIRDVAVSGGYLHYQPCADDTLTLHFFKKPPILTAPADVVTCIDDHLQESLLVNFACREIYNVKEDGQEDRKTNTKTYDSLYNSALAELLEQLEHGTEEPVYIEDAEGYES